MQALNGLTALPLIIFTLLFSLTTQAQETETTKAYISDNLFIYMHAGAGTQFRILGSINAGKEIQLTGEKENGYTQVINAKGKLGWVENKFINNKQSLRDVIAQLNAQLAQNAENEQESLSVLTEANNEVIALNTDNKKLESTITALNEELRLVKNTIKAQSNDELKQWFFNGAIVLGIGLLIGIFLPLLFKKKTKKPSWS